MSASAEFAASRATCRDDADTVSIPNGQVQVAVRLNPSRVLLVLAAAIGLLMGLSVAGDLLIATLGTESQSPLRTLAGRFVVDSELNLPTWYSSIAIFTCAILLAAIAAAQREADPANWKHWAVLSAIFVAMSLDEISSFHELPSGTIRRALDLDGWLRFAWVVLAVPLVLIVGCTYARFVWRLPVRTRRLFLLAAACFVGGAVGLEFVGGYLAEQHGMRDVRYLICATSEELLEMTGIAVFIYALLDYAARRRISFLLQADPNTTSRSASMPH